MVKYKIVTYQEHYRREETCCHEFATTNRKLWEWKVNLLTKDCRIVGWRRFKTPLRALGALGKLPAISNITFSENHGLSHEFMVLRLLDWKNGKSSAISFERTKDDGIVCQYAADNQVQDMDKRSSSASLRLLMNYRMGEEREDVQDLFSPLNEGIAALMMRAFGSVNMIVRMLDLDQDYNLLQANCQHLVRQWMVTHAKMSEKVMLKIPGSDELKALDDPAIVTVIEGIFPDWTYGKLQLLPEFQNPMAIPLSHGADVKEDIQFQFHCSKQKSSGELDNVFAWPI